MVYEPYKNKIETTRTSIEISTIKNNSETAKKKGENLIPIYTRKKNARKISCKNNDCFDTS